jgi:prolyl 4-hydroxylase
MSVMAEARRLATEGRHADGAALVERAAAERDAEAMFVLAHWRLYAMHGPRDLATALLLLEGAGELGHIEAVRVHAALVGNGTGCQADPALAKALLERIRDRDTQADAQLVLAQAMRAEEEFSAAMGEMLSGSPLVKIVRAAFTAQECAYLRAAAHPRLQPSFVIDPASGRRMAHPVRNSTGTNFGPIEEDLVVRRINLRLALLTGTDVTCGEPLHVLHYVPGQEYRLHSDALSGTENQRDWTALIYLNANYAGGETRFETGGLAVRGAEGDVLIFRNVDAAGRPDAATRHAGLPVTSGTKWLASRWIRRYPYNAFAG